MDYRLLTTPHEFEQMIDIEIEIWGLNPRDAVPSSMLQAVIHAGGMVLGAFEGDRLVGAAMGMPARQNGQLILWSHTTGVLPAYQGQDIGFTLKQRQREWALANDYNVISWTFDPFRRGNANFNLHRLGATAQTYLVNFYGEMSDGLNAGAPTHRLEAIWQLDDPRVISLAADHLITTDYPVNDPSNTLVRLGEPLHSELLTSGNRYLYAELFASPHPDADTHQQWRDALHTGLPTAFAAGYRAVDFIQADQRHWYVLRRL